MNTAALQTYQPTNPPKILVGLSGGVDSAVSAYLLKKEGYDVSAGFMINYLDEELPPTPLTEGGARRVGGECPTRADLEEAKRVAEFLEIPFYTFDYREEYEKRIVEYIYREYEAGRTPNPDVYCNNLVKFDLFLEEALSLGYDMIATGHYARISPPFRGSERGYPTRPPLQGEEMNLLKGIDPSKDQSYFLSRLTPFQLSKTLFPIGQLLKSEVRKIAKEANLPNAERKDSQGLCFIGKVSMKEFLERRIPKKSGNILDTSGKIIGTHEGAFSYTIGQRKGIKVGGGPALFVIDKDTKDNTITVGTEDQLELYKTECTIGEWIGEKLETGRKYQAKIRYRQEDQEVMVHSEGGMVNEKNPPVREEDIPKEDQGGGIPGSANPPPITMYQLRFATSQRAITPGQITVIYDGERVIGSGVIL